jgi:hypothetical protein
MSLVARIDVTQQMGWEQAGRTAAAPGPVTHIVLRGATAICGSPVRSIGPLWPASKAEWPPRISRCASCELLAFGGLR